MNKINKNRSSLLTTKNEKGDGEELCSYLVSMRKTKEGEKKTKRELKRMCGCVEMMKKNLEKELKWAVES